MIGDGKEPEQRVPLAAAAGLFRVLVAIPRHGEALDALVFGSLAEGRVAGTQPDAGA